MKTSRTPRLIVICQELKANPNRKPGELYKTLGVSKQQFYKDKDILEKEIGFKFRYSRRKRKYVIEKEPFIPTFNLTLTEVLALMMSVRHFLSTGDSVLGNVALNAVKRVSSQASVKVGKLLEEVFDNVVLQDGFGCDPKIFDALVKAINEGVRRVEITYHDYNQRMEVRRVIDPYTIFPKRRALYLDAYSEKHGEVRMFRLNRIRDIKPTDKIVPVRGDYSFSERHKWSFSVFTGGKPQPVRVKFGKRIALYIRESPWHPSQRITDLPGGDIILELKVAEPREVMWWALQWGAEAEILEPKWLRGEVIKVLNKSLENYI